MTYRMFIDDERTPKFKYDFVYRNSAAANARLVISGCPSYISFDYDLGGNDTAMNVVNFIINLDIMLKGTFIPDDFIFNIHSADQVGAKNIKDKLEAYLKFKEEN